MAAALALLLVLACGVAWGAECSSHAVQQALREDELTPITRVGDLPPVLLEKFWAAYGKDDRDHRIADPGEAYQEGDRVDSPRLPRRRLVVGARSERVAYLYYEKGGPTHSYQLFLTCLDAPDSAGFSLVKLPWDEWFPGTGVEKCLASPPRESLLPRDRGRCLPLPELPKQRIYDFKQARCSGEGLGADPDYVLSLDELPAGVRTSVTRYLDERVGPFEHEVQFRWGRVAEKPAAFYQLHFVLDAPDLAPLVLTVDLDSSGRVVCPAGFPDLGAHPERRPVISLELAKTTARTLEVPEDAELGLAYREDRDSLEWVFEVPPSDGTAGKPRYFHVPTQAGAMPYWGDGGWVR